MEYRMKDLGGRVLDARLDVIDSSVILHSRGGATGGRPPRNTGYAEALISICQRARAGHFLESVLMDSIPARLRPEGERLLIARPEIEKLDAEKLAKTIRVRMRRFGQVIGVSGGNSTKQIRFNFNLDYESIVRSLALKLAGGDGFSQTLINLPEEEFSTADFIVEYRAQYLAEWNDIEEQHGVGGKGAGQHRTVFTHVAHRLSALAREGEIYKLEYRPAPDWWGNGVVQYWSRTAPVNAVPGQNQPVDPEYREGSLRLKTHLRRERHWGLAKKKKADFVAKHGKLICERCLMDPGALFGVPIGNAVIEVHHAEIAVSAMGENHRTKLSDLRCLCANCHRLVHAEMSVGAT